ncbi:MAG TPA: ABC transporter permease [Bacillota bacterium]|nr:ABC transporter permease [Bacillota bacterium]
MDQATLIAVLATAVTAGTPLLFAALGEIVVERSGILNLGVEGLMLVGAVTGYIVALNTGSPWLGILAAMVGGGLVSLVHAFLTVTLRANQVVSGLALTIFGTGFSSFLGKEYIGMPLKNTFHAQAIPLLEKIPVAGPILFKQDPLVYVSYVLVAIFAFVLYRTRLGLNLRAVGENPAAADAVGISVSLTRYGAVFVGGMLGGAGGGYLSLAYAPSWLENMTAGRGWIAVALVIFAMWDPFKALLGSYIFGGVDALGFRIQTMNLTVSPFLLKALPYLLTVIVLIIITRETKTRRVGAPQALGVPYHREER